LLGRIAVRATRLDAPRPKSILDVVRQTGALQLDPTNAVARSELLVLWSRLGRYAVGDLDRLLWEERALFTWRAFLYPVEDWPIVAAAGSGFARDGQTSAWLRDNAAFERYVLETLKRDGPTPQSELEDRSVRPWESTGWTHGKNVTRMLEILMSRCEIAVSGREWPEFKERFARLREAVRLIRRLWTEPEVSFDGDEEMLQRMLVNVVRNAVQHTPAGQRVTIDVAVNGSSLTVDVTNQGSVIPDTDRERIFDRFVQLDPARRAGGSGLGLPIARWIAEAHGGSLMLKASDPRGTTFSIVLPLSSSSGVVA